MFLRDLANPQAQVVELKGQGSTPFDLGFTADSQAVGFSRVPVTPANPAVYDGFDLAARKTRNLPRDQLRGAIKTLDGWTLQGSIRNFVLEAKNQTDRAGSATSIRTRSATGGRTR